MSACTAEPSAPTNPTAAISPSSSGAAPPTPGRLAFPDAAPQGAVRAAEPDASGPENLDLVESSVRPDGGGADGIEVVFDRTSRTATGEKPAAPRRFVFLFDQSVSFHPEVFPVCEQAVIASRGFAGCPEGSRVGGGQVDTFPGRTAELAVFNTGYADGARGVLITVPATGAIFENTFEPLVEPYRGVYGMGSDEILPISPVPPGERAASSRFRVSFGASRRDGDQVHSFVRSTAAPGTNLRFGYWGEFVTGQVVRVEDEVARP
jgi:hypothetical protein